VLSVLTHAAPVLALMCPFHVGSPPMAVMSLCFFGHGLIGVACLCLLAGGPARSEVEIGGLMSATYTAMPVAGSPPIESPALLLRPTSRDCHEICRYSPIKPYVSEYRK
jgi:hypothetical protein